MAAVFSLLWPALKALGLPTLLAWARHRPGQAVAGAGGQAAVLAAVAVVVGGLAGLGVVWLRHAGDAPRMVFAAEVEARGWQARALALDRAAAELTETLAVRGHAAAQLEAEIDLLNAQLEASRAGTKDANAVCFDDSDSWLRAKRAGRAATGGATGHASRR